MSDTFPPPRQREALLKLVSALGCRDNALRRDECSDWRVNGKLGHIYAVPEGFQIYYRGAPEFEEPTSTQGWTWAKKALEPFCAATNDGDSEGMLLLDRLPTAAEAEILRDKLRIPKKREIGEAERERLRATGFRSHVDRDGSPLETPSESEEGVG
jgi:hypothetical protein